MFVPRYCGASISSGCVSLSLTARAENDRMLDMAWEQYNVIQWTGATKQ
jgi:hypothetical protein